MDFLEEEKNEIKEFAQYHNEVQTIKYIRDKYSLGLGEAKKLYDQIQNEDCVDVQTTDSSIEQTKDVPNQLRYDYEKRKKIAIYLGIACTIIMLAGAIIYRFGFGVGTDSRKDLETNTQQEGGSNKIEKKKTEPGVGWSREDLEKYLEENEQRVLINKKIIIDSERELRIGDLSIYAANLIKIATDYGVVAVYKECIDYIFENIKRIPLFIAEENVSEKDYVDFYISKERGETLICVFDSETKTCNFYKKYVTAKLPNGHEYKNEDTLFYFYYYTGMLDMDLQRLKDALRK